MVLSSYCLSISYASFCIEETHTNPTNFRSYLANTRRTVVTTVKIVKMHVKTNKVGPFDSWGGKVVEAAFDAILKVVVAWTS
jgi:hypothetical protein